MKPKSKVWVEEGSEQVFGRGRAEILKAIALTGSLNAAAAELNMSYRHLWSLVQITEKRLGKALLVRRRGGKQRGGTTLTPLAEAVLAIPTSLIDLTRLAENEICSKGRLLLLIPSVNGRYIFSSADVAIV